MSAESTFGVVPGRSPYRQEGAGCHQATDPGLSWSHQAHPASGVRHGGQFERTTSRRNNSRKRKPENLNAGLFEQNERFVKYYSVHPTDDSADLTKLNVFKVECEIVKLPPANTVLAAFQGIRQ